MSFGAMDGLQVASTIAGGLTPGENSFFYGWIERPILILQLVLATAFGFAALLLVFAVLGLVTRMLGTRMSQSWQYLYARFFDHRVWMLGLGYFSFLLTVLLFGQTPFQFNPEIDDENSQIEIRQTVPWHLYALGGGLLLLIAGGVGYRRTVGRK